MGESIPGFYPTKNKFTVSGIKKLLDGPIIVYIGKKETPGRWIYQKCKHAGCSRNIGYWSITSLPLAKYRDAKCERHQ